MITDLLLVNYLFGIIMTVQALVPSYCVRNVTSFDKVCCPIPDGFSNPCGGPGRGICHVVYVHLDHVEKPLLIDDRINWPNKFFKKLCRCEGNFYGLACEKCWYGWEGENCDRRKIITRRDIRSFSKLEKERIVKILQISNTIPSEFMILKESRSDHSDPLRNPRFISATLQQLIAFLHNYVSRSTLFDDDEMCSQYGYLDFNHNTVAFATWHRALMLYWERELAKIALREFNWEGFGIPYWDWIDATECEVCTNDLVGATGDFDPGNEIWLIDKRSPFHNWTEYCSPPQSNNRCVGCHFRKHFLPLNRKFISSDFPQTKNLEFVLRHSKFYSSDERQNNTGNCQSFHIAFEGFCDSNGEGLDYFHNKIHNMINGSMCCPSTAANDPIFIFHHSQVDRILECWFQIFSPSIIQLPDSLSEPGNIRESNIVGILPVIKHAQMFTKMNNLGIKYDNLHFGKKGFQCMKMASFIRKNKF